MNQLGAVKAASVVTGLVMVVGLLAVPSMTVQVEEGADGSDCDQPEAISIDAKLFNPKIDPSRPDATVELLRPIVAGIYSVTLVSFDRHGRQDDQTDEQWFVELLAADGRVVYESPETPDLPANQNFLSVTFDGQPVSGDAVRLRAVHLGVRDPIDSIGEGDPINSIVALCAVFTPDGRPEMGRIIVQKVTDPDPSDQRFTFTADYATFELRDGEQHDSGLILAGTYTVSEEGVPGWSTKATCSDGSAPGAIDLQEGEDVTCTFTNTFINGPPGLDLVVTLDDAPRGQPPNPPIVTPGDPFDYVINVLNLGPETAGNVEAVVALSDEVAVDSGALAPACRPSGPDHVECSIGEVPVGAIISVRVAVRVEESSPGLGTFLSSVVAGDDAFPAERNDPNNRDVEPTRYDGKS